MKTLVVYGYQNTNHNFNMAVQRAFTQQFGRMPYEWMEIEHASGINQDIQIGREVQDISLVLIPRIMPEEERNLQAKGAFYGGDMLLRLAMGMDDLGCVSKGSFSDAVNTLKEMTVFELYATYDPQDIFRMAAYGRQIHTRLNPLQH